MIDFTMDEKLVISAKWAQNERNKAYEAMKKVGINYFEPFQHQLLDINSFFKIRIGYVSYDFADHPLAHLLNSLFKFHDRNIFQIIGFSLRPDDKSVWRQNIANTCDEFYQMESGVSAHDLAKFINGKNIHILFNLNGWTAGARQDAFALRPAPIQI
jgi:predicted O-linked N-acetylglucosamine transferase (SPINDLY family)